jgi:cytochrome P450
VERAECPVSKLDFVNLVAAFGGVGSSAKSQPTNCALMEAGTLRVGDALMVNTRALVGEALRDPGLYSSEDLVEQGNTLPLIPLNIDPPAHVGYRKLLDPLFAPRRIDALEADITERVNHFIDAFVDRGSCDFTAELAELFPSSVFLGMMGLPWEELDVLVALRDGLLRPGGQGMAPEERSAIQRATAADVYAYFDAILDERAAAPRDDILSLFVSLEADEGSGETRCWPSASCS